MAHWAESYVGRPYDEEHFDCAHLVELVLAERFGRELALPHEHARNYRAQARQIEELKGDYAEPTTEPAEGDGVLLKARGYFEHLGVLCVIGRERWVLHNSRPAAAVCLHRVRDLAVHGLELEGYYRWI